MSPSKLTITLYNRFAKYQRESILVALRPFNGKWSWRVRVLYAFARLIGFTEDTHE